MKIAHVTATFPPYWAGTGNVAYHHVNGLHQRGYDVEVITAVPAGKEPLEFPFPVHYLPAVFRVGNAPLTPSMGRALQGADLIHLHYPYIFGAELCFNTARMTRTPIVVTYHNDLLSSDWKKPLFSLYSSVCQPWELKRADTLVATSLDYAHNSGLHKSVGHRVSRVIEVPNGVDPNQFCPGPAASWPGIPDGAPIVLFVGAMDTAHFFKGVPVLIDALSRLEGVYGLFVGDGDLRPQFEKMASEKLGNRAHFTRSIPLDRLIDAYRSARVTVLPSTTQGEAFGVVLLESLACGTPVVASNLPGVRTVVSEGKDGFLAEPGDATELAAAIEKCLDAETSAQLGTAGREKVLAKYSWDIVVSRLESVYEEVVSRTG